MGDVGNSQKNPRAEVIAIEEFAESIKLQLQQELNENSKLTTQVAELTKKNNELQCQLADARLRLAKATDENEDLRKTLGSYSRRLTEAVLKSVHSLSNETCREKNMIVDKILTSINSSCQDNSEGIDPRVLCLMDVGNLEDKAIPRISKGVQTSQENVATHLRNIDERVNCIKILPFFRKFPSVLLEALSRQLVEKVIKEGDYLVCPGEYSGYIFFLYFGKVTIRNAKKEEIGVLESKAVFGEIGIYDSSPRVSIVQAKSECIVYILNKEYIEQAVATSPNIKALFEKNKADWLNWKSRILPADWKECAGDVLQCLIYKQCSRTSLFTDLADDMLQAIAMSFIPKVFAPNDTILSTGCVPEHFNLILKGSVLVMEDKNIAAVLTRGGTFGEVGILIDAKQSGSVKAEDQSILCQLKKEDLMKLMNQHSEIDECISKAKKEKNEIYHKTSVGETKKENKIEQFDWEISQQHLTKMEIFRGMDAKCLQELALTMQRVDFPPRQNIITFGGPPESMFFLAHGEAEIVTEFGEVVDKVKGPSAYFGEVAVLQNVPRTATVRASSLCSVYLLLKESLMDLFRKNPEIETQIRSIANERMQKHLMRSVLA